MHTKFTHTARAAARSPSSDWRSRVPRPPRRPKRVEPLNQYVVSGKVDTDALAREGFDMREAAVTGKKGKFFIVATPSQARELAQEGRDGHHAVRRRQVVRRRRRARCSSPPTATTSSAPGA